MKKLIYLMLCAVVILTACKPKDKKTIVDTSVAKKEVTSLLEKFHSAFKAKDINAFKTLLDSNGLYCGTDSKELFNKDSVIIVSAQVFADTTFIADYKIDKREIQIASDGNSAIALEQFTIKYFSPKMPVRVISYLIKSNDAWIIDFYSYSFIPDNQDIGKINKALE